MSLIGWFSRVPGFFVAPSCELHDRMVPGCSNAFYAAFKGRPFVQGKSGEYDYFIREPLLGISELPELISDYILF